MTREEREETVKKLKEKRFEINTMVNGETPFSKALGFAIEALEQEPCEDAISRVEVESILHNAMFDYAGSERVYAVLARIRKQIDNLSKTESQRRCV